MAMSKQDYEVIAAAMAEARGRRGEHRLLSLLWLTRKLADEFAKTNPLFDADKFMNACQSHDNYEEETA